MAAVLVHIDLDGEVPHRASLLALAAGRHVASSWGATLYAAVIVRDPDRTGVAGAAAEVLSAAHVPGIDAVETALARAGADKVVVALTADPVVPLWASIGHAWRAVLDHLRPRLVLFGADSPSAPELGARTGARLGARLLVRARAVGIDDVELRDRDGGYVRASDGGAAVALIGRADPTRTCDDDVDLVVLAIAGTADPRLELVTTTAAELAMAGGPLVAISDALAGDAGVVRDAARLATLLGGHVVGGTAAARAGAVPAGAVLDASTAIAPELCVVVGGVKLDLAGATSLVKIGGPSGKAADGALPGPADIGLAELVKRLEML